MLDACLQIIWASPSAGGILGHPQEALVGKTVVEMIDPADLERIIPLVSEILGQAEQTFRTVKGHVGVIFPGGRSVPGGLGDVIDSITHAWW